MAGDLRAEAPPPADDGKGFAENLRLLSRSPHPYHRQNHELPHPSERAALKPSPNHVRGSPNPRDHLLSVPSFAKDSTPTSDSGTEADDEHFLRRLPAPKTKLHKGLRGRNEALSGTATPVMTPSGQANDSHKRLASPSSDSHAKEKKAAHERIRLRKEVIRRSTEVCLLVALGRILHTNPDARLELGRWKQELRAGCFVFGSLLSIYPLRLVAWAYARRGSLREIRLALPSSFDPAPLLYPPILPLFVALLVAVNVGGIMLPNIVLAVSSIPRSLIPFAQPPGTLNLLHWLLSCVPLFVSDNLAALGQDATSSSCVMPGEAAVLLYPLHQALCKVLHYLTTTSLLPAELELLSVGLINLAIAALSPQAVILKALLWGGGLGLALLCGQVIRWGISLARVPKWRFRRPATLIKKPSLFRRLLSVLAPRNIRREILKAVTDHDDTSSEFSGNSSGGDDTRSPLMGSSPETNFTTPRRDGPKAATIESVPVSPTDPSNLSGVTFRDTSPSASSPSGVPLLSTPPNKAIISNRTHTPSGRRKRSASISVRAFFYLTPEQATMRKWLYAGYVYVCILGIILLAIRAYVGNAALYGQEPIGWALGYLFGDLPEFRFQVGLAHLERWICLQPRSDDLNAESCHLGWVQHLRHASIGEANTRLVLSAYWLAVLVLGLAVVFRLSPIYEVDTRRKVFHFMMVAMLLPATFVDPTFAALALSLMLAIFLLLDLLRASQLPPLSKPIASFLAPFVDGRDHRGPVVISHIFLLIGCACPLWLSLAALPRAGAGFLRGWEVPTRDVSMVSGVVCVGLGDAAASLIGRRWGHHKWLWGGGKSLEGSAAFALAVFGGLMAASLWLRVGGWPVTGGGTAAGAAVPPVLTGGGGYGYGSAAWYREVIFSSSASWGATVRDAGLCASLASLTEAVLTGGNDNVVVPLVLWTCVKGLGL